MKKPIFTGTDSEWPTYTGEVPEGQLITAEETPPLVEVTWLDAWSDEVFFDQEMVDVLIPAIRKSSGYLLRNDDEVVVLTGELIDNSFVGKQRRQGLRLIPKPMVQEIITK